MSTITFTATNPDGTSSTRSSGSMAYSHALSVEGGDTPGWGILSWHKSAAGAFKASQARWIREHFSATRIVEALPTAVNGKATVEHYADWPNGDIIAELIVAKNAPKAAKVEAEFVPPVEKVSAPLLGNLEAVNIVITAQAPQTEAQRREYWAARKRASRARLASV
jgi:hypothetical protein